MHRRYSFVALASYGMLVSADLRRRLVGSLASSGGKGIKGVAVVVIVVVALRSGIPLVAIVSVITVVDLSMSKNSMSY